MQLEYLIRFVAGGAVVSIFAVLADILRPKSFAGLLGASPSIALVTLALAFHREGADYGATEGWSMIFGSIALALYAYSVSLLLLKARLSALVVATIMLPMWG